MTEIPTPLYVTQWVLLATFAILLLLLYRQLAYLLNLRRPPALANSLPRGVTAEDFRYRPFGGGETRSGRFRPAETSALLIFADPFCASCERLLKAITELPADHPLLSRWHPFFATTADASQLGVVPVFGDQRLDVGQVDGEVVTGLYRVPYTPFAYIFAGDGTVAARGPATSLDELLDLLNDLPAGDTPTRMSLAESIEVQKPTKKGKERIDVSN